MADGVPQLRDDDLSIPVLADILEPGDPAKADPGIPRPHIDHAWTDALILDAHAEPLGAVPMLNDILVPGDPARAQHVPQPAGAGLTIPLLTEVLSYPEAHEDRLHDEMSGAPIPLLTDVIADFDDAGDGSEDVEPAAIAMEEATQATGQTDKATVPEAIQEAAAGAAHEAGLEPAARESEAQVEAHAEPQAEPLEEALSADAFAFEVDDVPLLTDVFTPEVAPVEQHAAPVWHGEAGAEEPIAASASEPASEPVPASALESESTAEPASWAPMDLSALASSIEANLLDSELPFSAYSVLPGEPVPAPIEVDESAVPAAQPVAKAHLLDSELPFRAYCAFPGEPAQTPIDVGDSAVPPAWPMAKVPLPFGSGEPPELPALDSAVPETFVDEAPQARAVIEPESSQADEVSTYPVPFEAIATEVLPEVELQQPEATQPEVIEAEAETEALAPAMAETEADHLAAMLAHPEPVAAELTEPQPEYLSDLALVPAQVEIDHVAADVRARALRYLAGEGHALIESRCQEQAVWLAHRITREIAATLEREIGQWVQDALNDALTKRLPPR
jgi:hypothetical protein